MEVEERFQATYEESMEIIQNLMQVLNKEYETILTPTPGLRVITQGLVLHVNLLKAEKVYITYIETMCSNALRKKHHMQNI